MRRTAGMRTIMKFGSFKDFPLHTRTNPDAGALADANQRSMVPVRRIFFCNSMTP